MSIRFVLTASFLALGIALGGFACKPTAHNSEEEGFYLASDKTPYDTYPSWRQYFDRSNLRQFFRQRKLSLWFYTKKLDDRVGVCIYAAQNLPSGGSFSKDNEFDFLNNSFLITYKYLEWEGSPKSLLGRMDRLIKGEKGILPSEIVLKTEILDALKSLKTELRNEKKDQNMGIDVLKFMKTFSATKDNSLDTARLTAMLMSIDRMIGMPMYSCPGNETFKNRIGE